MAEKIIALFFFQCFPSLDFFFVVLDFLSCTSSMDDAVSLVMLYIYMYMYICIHMYIASCSKESAFLRRTLSTERFTLLLGLLVLLGLGLAVVGLSLLLLLW